VKNALAGKTLSKREAGGSINNVTKKRATVKTNGYQAEKKGGR